MKMVQISVDRLDALKLKQGILTDMELAKRLGVSPSHIFNLKAQGRCRQTTAERLAKVIGWGFVDTSAAQGPYTKVTPYELPTLEEVQRLHLLERGGAVAEDKPEPPTPTLEETVLEFIARPVPERWNERRSWPLQRRAWFWAGNYPDEKLMERDRVCAAEVWAEALHKPPESMTYNDAKCINAIIAKAPEWTKSNGSIRFGPYGKQRGFCAIKRNIHASNILNPLKSGTFHHT